MNGFFTRDVDAHYFSQSLHIKKFEWYREVQIINNYAVPVYVHDLDGNSQVIKPSGNNLGYVMFIMRMAETGRKTCPENKALVQDDFIKTIDRKIILGDEAMYIEELHCSVSKSSTDSSLRFIPRFPAIIKDLALNFGTPKDRAATEYFVNDPKKRTGFVYCCCGLAEAFSIPVVGLPGAEMDTKATLTIVVRNGIDTEVKKVIEIESLFVDGHYIEDSSTSLLVLGLTSNDANDAEVKRRQNNNTIINEAVYKRTIDKVTQAESERDLMKEKLVLEQGRNKVLEEKHERVENDLKAKVQTAENIAKNWESMHQARVDKDIMQQKEDAARASARKAEMEDKRETFNTWATVAKVASGFLVSVLIPLIINQKGK